MARDELDRDDLIRGINAYTAHSAKGRTVQASPEFLSREILIEAATAENV